MKHWYFEDTEVIDTPTLQSLHNFKCPRCYKQLTSLYYIDNRRYYRCLDCGNEYLQKDLYDKENERFNAIESY